MERGNREILNEESISMAHRNHKEQLSTPQFPESNNARECLLFKLI